MDSAAASQASHGPAEAVPPLPQPLPPPGAQLAADAPGSGAAAPENAPASPAIAVPILAQTSFGIRPLPVGAFDQALEYGGEEPASAADAEEATAAGEGGLEGGPVVTPAPAAPTGAASPPPTLAPPTRPAAAGKPSWFARLAPRSGRRAPAGPVVSREYTADEHKLSLSELATRFGTDINPARPEASRGLTEAEASARLAANGPNRLTPPPEVPEWLKFLKQLTNGLLLLMIAAVGLAILAWALDTSVSSNIILAGTLAVIILITAFINYWHERSAHNVLAAISTMLSSNVAVVRDGAERKIPTEQLVVGDVVHLTIGNRVPADIRLISVSDYKIELSSLTGESDHVECFVDKRSDMVTEARNIAFNSALTMNGEARGVVIRTGDDTFIGTIARLVGATQTGRSSLEVEVAHVIRFVIIIAIITACIFFAIGLARGRGFVFAIVNGLLLTLIANVPEGLPTTVVSVLTLTAQRLAQRHVFIKRTDVIETLGSCTVIASDKTGTLTQNQMTVSNSWVNKTFGDAGVVRFTATGPRAIDPSAAMSIGRTMTAMRDGSMVIHSTTRGGGAIRSGLTSLAGALPTGYEAAGEGLTVRGASVQRRGSAAGRRLPNWPDRGGGGGGLASTEGARLSAFPLGSSGGATGPASAGPASSTSQPGVPRTAPDDTAGVSKEAPGATAAAGGGRVVTSPAVRVSAPAAATPAVAAGGAASAAPTPTRRAAVSVPATAASFRGFSFQGLAGLSWDGANPFTRLIIIAAVCNRAIFSFEEEDGEGEEPTEPAAVSSGSSRGGRPVPAPTGVPSSRPEAVSTAEGGTLTEGRPRLVAGAALGSPTPAGDAALPPGRRQGPRPEGQDMWGRPVATEGAKKGPVGDAKRRGYVPSAPRGVLSPRFRGDTRKVLGDASEAALLRYVDALMPVFEYRTAFPVVHEVPFNSINKWALAIARSPDAPSTRHLVFLKGAPERVLERCTHYVAGDKELPIDEAYRTEHQAAYERFGMKGERVLSFAYKVIPARPPSAYKDAAPAPGPATAGGATGSAAVASSEPTYPTTGLVHAGLISLMDPPKVGVPDAIDKCRTAYIKVIMVTGDHPLTAESIARQVGIVTFPTAREVAAEDGVEEHEVPLDDPRVQAAIVPGYVLPDLTETQWDTLLAKEEIVFARTSPQQKLQIVEHLQRLGHVVAVTGDGTNDAPALRKASIGVSMGSALASDVAREAADIVLLNDDFASIVVAIEQGRLCFANLRKTSAYTLSHAMPELFPIFLDLAFGIPLALTGLQILTIDLLTEQGPAISLAYEPPESNIMQQPPRRMKQDRLIDGRVLRYAYIWIGLLITGVCLMAYFLVFVSKGIPGSAVWNSSSTYWTESSPDLVVGGKVFSGPTQQNILRQAHSAYYFNLIACQAVNAFLVKTRYVSIFTHGLLSNPFTLVGVAVALLIGLAIIYIDAWQGLFETAYMSGYWFLTPLVFAAIAVPATEKSKAHTRKHPEGWWARNMQW